MEQPVGPEKDKICVEAFLLPTNPTTAEPGCAALVEYDSWEEKKASSFQSLTVKEMPNGNILKLKEDRYWDTHEATKNLTSSVSESSGDDFSSKLCSLILSNNPKGSQEWRGLPLCNPTAYFHASNKFRVLGSIHMQSNYLTTEFHKALATLQLSIKWSTETHGTHIDNDFLVLTWVIQV